MRLTEPIGQPRELILEHKFNVRVEFTYVQPGTIVCAAKLLDTCLMVTTAIADETDAPVDAYVSRYSAMQDAALTKLASEIHKIEKVIREAHARGKVAK